MLVFRCTRRLRQFLGIADRELLTALPTDCPVVEWYGNVVLLERRKNLMLCHRQTLYTILVPMITKADVKDFTELFRRQLDAALRLDGFSHLVGSTLLADTPTRFAKATDRAVLGSMNDHARIFAFLAEDDGGLANLNLRALHYQLNTAPMGLIGMDSAYSRLGDSKEL